jgi:hypothetical protein
MTLRRDTPTGRAMDLDLSNDLEASCGHPKKMRGFFGAFPSWPRSPRARLRAYACNLTSKYRNIMGIVGIFLLPNCGIAQTLEHSLRNAKDIFVLIEDHPPDTAQCNVDKTTVRSAIDYQFSEAHFTVHTKDTIHYLRFYVRAAQPGSKRLLVEG